MEEKSRTMFSKKLEFEKSGETLVVTIELNDVSPHTNKKSISGFLDELYKRVIGDYLSTN